MNRRVSCFFIVCVFSHSAASQNVLWSKDPSWVSDFIKMIDEKRFTDRGLAELGRIGRELTSLKTPNRAERIKIGLLYKSGVLNIAPGFDDGAFFASYKLQNRSTLAVEALFTFCSVGAFHRPRSMMDSLTQVHADTLLRLYPSDFDLMLKFGKVSSRDKVSVERQVSQGVEVLARYRRLVPTTWKADYLELSFYRNLVYSHRRLADIEKCELLIPKYLAHKDLPEMLRKRLPTFEKFLKKVKAYVVAGGK